MYPINRRTYLLRLFADTVTLVVAFILLVIYWYLRNYGGEPLSRMNSILLIVSLSCWYFSAKILHTYHRMKVLLFSVKVTRLLKTVLLHTLLFSFCLLVLFPYYPHQRNFLISYLVLAVVLLAVERDLVRRVIRRVHSRGLYSKKVLIVGAGVRGMQFYENKVETEESGYVLSGFLDDERKESLNGQYLGPVRNLDAVLKSREVDDVVIALPVWEVDLIVSVIKTSERNAKRVKVLPDYGIPGLSVNTPEDPVSASAMDVRTLPLDDYEGRLLKRCFDVLFASLVLIFLLSWLFPIIALLIKMNSRGPIFFKQLRTGLNNHNFWCLKFRSMTVNDKADQLSASRNDVRMTKIGRILRKTSLDELPQFFNVLLGNMSIVGPRPHMVKQNKDFSVIVDEYMLRHFVKPGITGWAQVNGYRGEISKEEDIRKRVEHDIWYIENWKFSLDIQIILQTVINIVKGEEKAF